MKPPYLKFMNYRKKKLVDLESQRKEMKEDQGKHTNIWASHVGTSGEEPARRVEDIKNAEFHPRVGRAPGEGVAAHSGIPAWRLHGQKGLVGYSP